MKKQFNHILDLNNKDKVYPVDKSFYTLFFTIDRRFFIYALYTRTDFSTPELIEVDMDSYMRLRDESVIENFAESVDDIAKILINIKKEAIIDNLNVGQILDL